MKKNKDINNPIISDFKEVTTTLSDYNIPTLQQIGQRLRLIREERNLSQSELASKIGKTQTLIAHWEKGDREVKITDVFQLSKQLNVNPCFLLCFDNFLMEFLGQNLLLTDPQLTVLKAVLNNNAFVELIKDRPAETVANMRELWRATSEIMEKYKK